MTRSTTVMCNLCEAEGDNETFFVEVTASNPNATLAELTSYEIDICYPCIKALYGGHLTGRARKLHEARGSTDD